MALHAQIDQIIVEYAFIDFERRALSYMFPWIRFVHRSGAGNEVSIRQALVYAARNQWYELVPEILDDALLDSWVGDWQEGYVDTVADIEQCESVCINNCVSAIADSCNVACLKIIVCRLPGNETWAYPAFVSAIHGHNRPIIDFLLEDKRVVSLLAVDNVSDSRYPLLETAASYGSSLEVIQKIHHAIPNTKHNQANRVLQVCAKGGFLPVIRWLVDVFPFGSTALFAAAGQARRFNHEDVAQFLLGLEKQHLPVWQNWSI